MATYFDLANPGCGVGPGLVSRVHRFLREPAWRSEPPSAGAPRAEAPSAEGRDGWVCDGLAHEDRAHDGWAHDGWARGGRARGGWTYDGWTHGGWGRDGRGRDGWGWDGGRLTGEALLRVRFRVSPFREGYRQREVDEFLRCAAVSLGERAQGRVGSITADDVVFVILPSARLLPGYDRGQVDHVLDRLVEALA